MKWNKIINFFLASLLLVVLFGCGAVTKEIAGDDLAGGYQGTETTINHLSKFNIGLEDEVINLSTGFNIIKNDEGRLKIVFQNISITLSAVQLATNGTVFNIPEQSIVLDGNQIKIRGLNECTFGEMRCDGFYNNQTKKLIFSYEGVIPFVEQGIQYDVPFSCSYDVTQL
jgi:hypothetical protein